MYEIVKKEALVSCLRHANLLPPPFPPCLPLQQKLWDIEMYTCGEMNPRSSQLPLNYF